MPKYSCSSSFFASSSTSAGMPCVINTVVNTNCISIAATQPNYHLHFFSGMPLWIVLFFKGKDYMVSNCTVKCTSTLYNNQIQDLHRHYLQPHSQSVSISQSTPKLRPLLFSAVFWYPTAYNQLCKQGKEFIVINILILLNTFLKLVCYVFTLSKFAISFPLLNPF